MEEKLEISINDHQVSCLEFQGQRVITLSMIDDLHERPEGTARKRFNDNRDRFIEGEDYFVRKTDEAADEFGIVAPNGLIVLTESGYLMLVKTFRDNLSWDIQRSLVNTYFNYKNSADYISRDEHQREIEEQQGAIDELSDYCDAMQKHITAMERELAELRSRKPQISTNYKASVNATMIISSAPNKSRISVSQISQFYGMSAHEFNIMLRDAGVQVKGSDSLWQLTYKYATEGYVNYVRYDNPDCPKTMYWTPLGVAFLVGFLAERNMYPMA